jgi:hypothetical protein
MSVPQQSNCNGNFKLAIVHVGTGQGVVMHHHRGGGAPAAPKTSFRPSLEKYGGARHQTVQWPWQCPFLLKPDFHDFNLVELLVSFPKSGRSSKLKFGAKSYARNMKGCRCSPWHHPRVAVHRPGVVVPYPVHTKRGGSTTYNGCKLSTS